ncbi:MAG: diguanylate cyclase [Alphaproteobacteria bacterium]|nr:MAG: diguanylate cyclase [Alphaproteobacteria bacterium]
MSEPSGGDAEEKDIRSQELIAVLAASRQLYKDLVACAGGFCWETDAGGAFTFIDGSERLGYPPLALLGRDAKSVFGLDAETAALTFQAKSPLEQADVWLTHGEGRLVCLQLSARPLHDPAGNWRGARGMGFDVTLEREQAEALADAHAKLERQARSDPLTGLANRRAFMDTVTARLAHVARSGRPSALLYIDLDHFKAVNDHYGHAAGDAILLAVGDILRRSLRASDLAARLGGDEFAVWLEDADGAGATRMAQRLIEQASALRVAIGGGADKVGLSIGIAVAGGREAPQDLLARADAALYRAKNRGRGKPALVTASDARPLRHV